MSDFYAVPMQPYRGGVTPAYPAARAASPAPAAAVNDRPPRVEVSLDRTTLYPQQALVYAVRVFSEGNIKTIALELPKIPDFMVESLIYAETREHWQDKRKGFVTEYLYALTPLRTGSLEIPPVKVVGEFATAARGAESNSAPAATFAVTAGADLAVEVLTPEAGVKPWRALDFLRTHAEFADAEAVRVGEPLSLTVSLEGTGTLAHQLPSVAADLNPVGAKVYRESVSLENRLGPGRSSIIGKRVERFTLIPVKRGGMAIADVDIRWWNARQQRQEISAVRFPTLFVEGATSQAVPDSTLPAATGRNSVGLSAILIIGALIVAPYLLFWLAKTFGWLDRLRLLRQRWQRRAGSRVAIAKPEPAGPAPLSPRYHLRRLWQRFVHFLPAPYKIWYCVNRLEIEDNPADWCQLFQLYSTKYLEIPVNSPIPQITGKLIETNARINPDRMQRLVDEMEGCNYGGTPIEFESWKRRFRHETRPPLLPFGGWRRKPRQRLPALNPNRIIGRDE
ncbi:MAG: BatD family protein [Thiotrichales bacterium]